MKININTTLLAILIILIIVLIIRQPKAPDNTEMLNKIEELNQNIAAINEDIQQIKNKKEEVKTKINDTKTSIKAVQSKKMVINNRPFDDEQSLQLLTDFFKKRGVPTSSSK